MWQASRPDTTVPPTVVSHSPNNGATGVSQAAIITATFSEDMNPATIGSSTFELRGPGNTLVTATVTYNGGARTATLDPSSNLLASTSYTATVKGGATGAKDAGGLAMVSDFVWTFTTEAAACSSSCSGWSDSTTPTNASANDPNAVELGVKFRSDLNGFIAGIRFYKGAGNTGTHVGRLWTAGGTQLATATFTSETASGWQQVSFAAPVAITANTVYVASYHAPNGGYAFDSNFFASGFQNGPLYFLSNGESGGNGLYRYNATAIFPINTFNSTNYWVDVVFTTSAGGVLTLPPTDPTNLSATAVETSQINLTWTGSTDNVGVSGYRVERCQGAGCTGFAEVATPTGTTHPDTGLTAGTTYRYRVRAADAVPNFSGYSNIATATTHDPPPGQPTGLSATASASGVALTWSVSPEPDLAGYHVYRRPSGSGPFTRLNASLLATPAFEDTLAPSGTSDYTVTAVDAAGNESAQASSVPVTMTLANRLLNPGFELDANNDTRPDSWTSNANFTRSNALARSGSYSGRHLATNNAGYTITQGVSGLTAGRNYTFAGWVNIPATTDAFTLTLRVRWRTVLQIVLRTDVIKAYTTSSAGWDKAALSLTAPILTTNAQVEMVVSSLNGTVYVDDFALR